MNATASKEDLLAKIEELENRLSESEQMLDAIKEGEVDAFAFNRNDKQEIYTLQSGDYAYRILIENFNEGALNLSEDGLIVYTNTYICDLIKLPYEKIIGSSVFNLIHTSSKKAFKELFRKGLAGQSKGEINLVVGNSVTPVYVSLTSLYPKLPTVGMIVTDLTERKKQELILKKQNAELEHNRNFISNVLQSTNHGVLSYLAIREDNEIVDFEIRYANDIALRQLKMTADEVIGKKYLTVIPNAKELGSWQRIVRVLTTGITETHELSPPDYPDRFLKAYFAPLDDGITVTYIDITEQKRQAHILEKKNLELAKINQELETFNFMSSHDLQEPLRKIELFSELLLKEEQNKLSDSGQSYLHRMQNTVGRMRMLIQDLLAYFQIKNAEIKYEKVDLNEILAEAIADLEETIRTKNATITTDGFCEMEVIRFQFRQLFYNLISNALKFSDPGRLPQISITCSSGVGKDMNNGNLLPDLNYYHFTFTDNGIGFAPIYKDRIFEAFQRLHEYDEYKGTGIGLAICKKIVENHDGIITATGELNTGARFDIYIPKR